MNYKPTRFSYLPEVVKNLLIINGLFFLGNYVLYSSFGIELSEYLGLHNWQSPDFKPHQLITHIFMHDNLMHLLLNMFVLWMFGNQLENIWGGKRFLMYFMVTGLGAAILYIAVNQIQIGLLESKMSIEKINIVVSDGYQLVKQNRIWQDPELAALTVLYYKGMVGASGAVFGLLLAFGMLFPNSLIYIFGIIPVKSKYFVIAYGILELWLGILNKPEDNIAHFAHLGGMIFGYFLIKYWRKNSNHFY